MKEIDFEIREFPALDVASLYDILRLRSEVFVVEQDCVYQDMDGLDHKSLHLTAHHTGQLAGYARILPPGLKYKEASIGRIVTDAGVRRSGVGLLVVERGISECRERWPASAIRISAQCYLERFYRGFGFQVVSDIYLEDGIDHQEMLLEF